MLPLSIKLSLVRARPSNSEFQGMPSPTGLSLAQGCDTVSLKPELASVFYFVFGQYNNIKNRLISDLAHIGYPLPHYLSQKV